MWGTRKGAQAALVLVAVIGQAIPTTASSQHACSLFGDVGLTTASGTDARTGANFVPGENIYGPFEAGFGAQQSNILVGLGCSDGSLGYIDGGIDTQLSEQMVAYQCSVTLPRLEGDNYISLIDECGGHTREYHFHERMSCLYPLTGQHSAKVGEASTGQFLYGKWEDYDATTLPLLDACGGHYGFTPESPTVLAYHYHVQDAAPFAFGCYGPNDDGSLVTVQQCRAFYPNDCDGELSDVTTSAGTSSYDLWCPCYDAMRSNSGVNIQELPVFSSTDPLTGDGWQDWEAGTGSTVAPGGNECQMNGMDAPACSGAVLSDPFCSCAFDPVSGCEMMCEGGEVPPATDTTLAPDSPPTVPGDNSTRPGCITVSNDVIDRLERAGYTAVACEEMQARRRLQGLAPGPPCPTARKARNLLNLGRKRHVPSSGRKQDETAENWV